MGSADAYRAGFADGVAAYAHMKSGVSYVGTTGRTLKEAIANVEQTWNYRPPEADHDKLAADSRRYRWLLPILIGGEGGDQRTLHITAALMRGLDGDAAIDAAMAAHTGDPK